MMVIMPFSHRTLLTPRVEAMPGSFACAMSSVKHHGAGVKADFPPGGMLSAALWSMLKAVVERTED